MAKRTIWTVAALASGLAASPALAQTGSGRPAGTDTGTGGTASWGAGAPNPGGVTFAPNPYTQPKSDADDSRGAGASGRPDSASSDDRAAASSGGNTPYRR